MKTVIASALLLASSGAYAHNSCDAELQGGLKIAENSIEFYQDEVLVYQINDQSTLWVDGKKVNLTSAQQALVEDYSTRIHAMVPEVKNIVMDGIDLATDGINLAFTELMGEGSQIAADLNTELETIRTEINAKFASQEGIYINHDGEDFLGDDFEQRIEQAVEKTMTQSIGSLLVMVGKEMMLSGGDADAFERRMEEFSQTIEAEVEKRAAAIEGRADDICRAVAKIDEVEDAMRQQIEALRDYDMVTVRLESDKKA